MRNTTHNYILTGSTGILGSHILYELMQSIHNNNYRGRIVLLIRSKKDVTSRDRFLELLSAEAAPDYLNAIDMARMNRLITIIDSDLRFLDCSSLEAELGAGKYHLIHCAASVNLGTSASALADIRNNNYLGTLNLVNSLQNYLSKVSYVSTAFSLCSKDGTIVEQNTDRTDTDFRNHYERYKVQTEKEVEEICKAHKLPYQVFRPSIICGRLVDYPYHVIPRFLVFYLFGAFFYKAKAAYGEQPVRIAMNTTSGLNIIPVDYTAKAIVRALPTDIKALNIVSRKSVPNIFTAHEMMRVVGWTNYEIMDKCPSIQNPLEKLYYRTVGAQLSHYMNTPESPDAHFNVDILRELMKDINEPNVDAHFGELCTYAMERGFNNLVA